MPDPEKIDTTNHFSVGMAMNGTVTILIPPAGPLSKAEAYNLAAYLVALVSVDDGPEHAEFLKVLEAIENT